MSLSQELLPQILRLTEAISRMRVDYPNYDLQRFFRKNAEKLKAQGLEASRFTDIDLVSRLGDFLETSDFSLESICKTVDKSSVKTEGWVLEQIDGILKKKGWSDYSQNNSIRELMLSRPSDSIGLIQKTLDRLSSEVQILHSRLKDLDDPFFSIEKQQYRVMYDL